MDVFGFSKEIEKALSLIEDSMRLAGDTDDEIHKFFDEDESFAEVYEAIMEDISDSIINSLSEHIDEDNNKEKMCQSQKRKRFDAIWGQGLAWLRRYYTLSLDIIENFKPFFNSPDNHSRDSNIEKTLYLLNARALLVFSEIICLLENGFCDGAYAHYRTLYELWAVAEFIFHDSDADKVSLSFLNSIDKEPKQESDHYKWAKTSKRFEGCVQITISSIVKKAHETYMLRPGEETSLTKLSKRHEFPNILIHPSAMGLEILSDSFPEAKTIGISNPAISSSIMLNEINSLYLHLFMDNIKYENVNPFIRENSYVCATILDTIVKEKIIPIFNEIEYGDATTI